MQSGQSPGYRHEEALYPLLHKMIPVEGLIRLTNICWSHMSGGKFSDVTAHMQYVSLRYHSCLT